MATWLIVVEVVRGLVFAAAHFFGGSIGAGILATSLVARLALLPLTIRAARRALEHQRRVTELAPQVERLRRRYRNDRVRLADETMALYRKNGIGLLPRGMMGSVLAQLPINAALYQAVAQGLGRGTRFFWIDDLARPDVMVATLAAMLAGLAASGEGSTASRTAMSVSAGVSFLIAWRLSAALGLYWVASNAVSAVQSVMLRRMDAPARSASSS
jgi:YidC/Oxa1 family membrane protein insertase